MTIYATEPRNDTAFIAHCYHEAGLAVIPLRLDGSKEPVKGFRWGQAHYRRSWEQLAHHWSHPCGIGVICGGRSGNLEVLDFDCHHSPSVYPRWASRVAPALLSKLVIVATPSGGRHAWYRSSTAEGSKPLARDHARLDGELPHATIELKSEGAYIVAPGSPPATHPDHDLYDIIQNDPRNPPLLTIEELEQLHQHARALNLYTPPPADTKPKIDRTKLRGRKLPGDIFNQQAEWEDILLPHGWQIAATKGDGTTLWTKPDGTRGHTHATTGYGGGDCLYIFTTDCPKPFEPNTPYTKFAAFTMLEYDGDFKRAAAALKTKHL